MQNRLCRTLYTWCPGAPFTNMVTVLLRWCCMKRCVILNRVILCFSHCIAQVVLYETLCYIESRYSVPQSLYRSGGAVWNIALYWIACFSHCIAQVVPYETLCYIESRYSVLQSLYCAGSAGWNIVFFIESRYSATSRLLDRAYC